MVFTDSLKNSFQTIFSHKLRSFLTLLGIIIGMISLTTMFTSVYFIQKFLHSNIDKFGIQNSVTVKSKNEFSWKWFMSVHNSGKSKITRIRPISLDDYEILRKNVDYKHIFGTVEKWTRTTNNKWIRVYATNQDYFYCKKYVIHEGRFFNVFEHRNADKVALVGPFFSTDYLNGENPVGQKYTIDNNVYTIIGVIWEEGIEKYERSNFFSMSDYNLESFYIPLKTGATYLSTNKTINSITLQAHDEHQLFDMQNQVNQYMLANHKMSKDFEFEDWSIDFMEFLNKFKELSNKWFLSLIIISSISLLVGGIGLFSTLLISINERMMEIGVRKSLGARDIDIFTYFISEAIILSLIASIIGITISVLIIKVVSIAVKLPVGIPFISIFLSLVFAFIIGFVSGMYPAINASKINPIQAIYYFD
jgi:putative ABC transport system permease protein